MSISGIQGRLLEVTVVGCSKLKDTEWISRQDPYVVLEYGNTKFRTRTCTDGGKNPVFQEKFTFTLIEGLREIHAVVWNSNSVTHDDFIGNGKVQLQDVLSRGYDDRSWSLQTKTGRYAGELKLIMHYNHSSMPTSNFAPSAPPYAPPSQSHAPSAVTVAYSNPYSAYPPPTGADPGRPMPYAPPSSAYPSQTTAYPSYPPRDPSYPPGSVPYSASPYPPPPAHESAYPPPTYPPSHGYPPPPYPPPPHGRPPYPSPPHGPPPHHPPPGHYPGMHPPPPY